LILGRFEELPGGVVAVLAVEHDVAGMKAHLDVPLFAFLVFVPPTEFHAHEGEEGAKRASDKDQVAEDRGESSVARD
jgi:hypothetical protein